MAAGPGYRPDLDLVLRADGVPVAVATAWWAGPGATAILEPVATHGDHRGSGWGRAVVQAALGRLRDLGASGVSVCTPVDYVGAVATYRSAGLRPLEQKRSLVRQPAA
jgi:ribosomal protein S18 acetylase RimI-like enzyme